MLWKLLLLPVGMNDSQASTANHSEPHAAPGERGEHPPADTGAYLSLVLMIAFH